ncbi:MAG: hypothetical protein A2381_02495 [Bdellovibrionales bacterium RIFOXYB1_FULL_37_110]|nr:MAG: hypothetical protein A2417_13800 [Bdellovibrionales bacterium RIFOXYC1_FULL_37_79]OFZ59305.1 MAG: hypothetical protein A2381_02495 [Bdellovibrionales bacterium RIFOXYB1_FULL_37_110]OFZ62931.1 MAG: hypothetical protein A2577_11450 [Bdellovibrionales bacterium RIFOXYD1_FULL_36_51]
MSKIRKILFLNPKGALSIVEVFIAAAISLIAYYSFTSMYDQDHDNIVRLETKWQAQLTAESIASTISSLKVEKMYNLIMDNSLLLGTEYASNSKNPKTGWLKSWVKLTPRIIKVSYQVNVYDKNRTTRMPNKNAPCFQSLDHFKRCHKEIIANVTFNFKKEDIANHLVQNVSWTTWIMGKELPNLF